MYNMLNAYFYKVIIQKKYKYDERLKSHRFVEKDLLQINHL